MAKDTKKVKKEKKEKKAFFKEFKAELKKVTWPTPKQLAAKTAIVIAIVLIISVIVFGLDFVFDKGYEFVVTQSSKMLNKDEETQPEGNTNDGNSNDGNQTEVPNETENVDGAETQGNNAE